MMSKYDYDLITIGGGAAGLTASTGAGSLGVRSLLIEKESKLGGDCLHYGCVPSKALIKSAQVYHQARHANKYGLPSFNVPAVDMKMITARIKNIIDEIQVHDSPEYIKEKYNVETQFGEARFVDPHTIELNDQKLTAKKFILASGSSPMVPLIEGLDKVPYLTNLNVFSMGYLPKSLIVLGGGPIGVEMAQAFNRLGSQVTIIEFADRLLSKEDEDVSSFITGKLVEEGVNVFVGHKAVKVAKHSEGVVVTVDNGQSNTLQNFVAQTLLVATGRKANVDGLGLDDIGVAYSSRGIEVNKYLKTTMKHIYACGDCNGGHQFTHVAGYEGGLAMVNAMVHLPVSADYSKVPWVTYLDPEIASVGYNEWMAKKENIDYEVHKEYFKDNHRAIAESDKEGFIKIIISKGKPIGCQIVGANAGDLISEWVAILNGKVSLSTMAQAIHPYPTKAELNKVASGNYVAPQFFDNPVIKWLAKI